MRGGGPRDAHRQGQGVPVRASRSPRRPRRLHESRTTRGSPPAPSRACGALMTIAKNSPACRVAPVTVRRVGGPATHWSAAQMAAAGGTARGHHQGFRHTAWSPWLVAGCVPARSGPAGTGRGPYPPRGTPALDHKENRAKRAGGASEESTAESMQGRLCGPVRYQSEGRDQDVRGMRHDDDVDIGERPSTKPKPVPLPWVKSPRKLPFRTGEPT